MHDANGKRYILLPLAAKFRFLNPTTKWLKCLKAFWHMSFSIEYARLCSVSVYVYTPACNVILSSSVLYVVPYLLAEPETVSCWQGSILNIGSHERSLRLYKYCSVLLWCFLLQLKSAHCQERVCLGDMNIWLQGHTCVKWRHWLC